MDSPAMLDRRSCDVLECIMCDYSCYQCGLLLSKIEKASLFDPYAEGLKRLSWIKRTFPTLNLQAGRDFLHKNSSMRTEWLITTSVMSTIWDYPDDWHDLFQRNPGKDGLVCFSVVGFNLDDTCAITYGVWMRGTRFHGHVFSLMASDSGWSIDFACGVIDG